MDKKKLIILISSIASVVVLAVAITLILVFTLGKSSDSEKRDNLLDSARNIKIVQIEGSGTVTDDKDTITCFKGMNLYDGDSLKVNEESVIVVRFDEDKYVYLGENTKVNIKSEGKDKHKTNVYVEYGIVLAEIQNKLGEDEEFFLSSNNSVMAVRGTIFGVEVKDNGNEFVETYSVYKGVTELVVFDKDGNNIIKGKLTDISNKKIEIKVPKDHVVSKDDFDNLIGNWLTDIDSKFDDPEDANNKLDEVNITVDVPSEDDYKNIVDMLTDGEGKISYSSIEYTSQGFFGSYDGEGHSITVTPASSSAKVYYKGEGESQYKETNDYVFYAPGTYRVYYKITLTGCDDKEDYEVIVIAKPNILIQSDYIFPNSTSGTSVLDITGMDAEAFNCYNGVKYDDLFNDVQFIINNNVVKAKNISFTYNKIMDGYVELVDGQNTINLTLEFDDYTINTDAYFYFNDTREDPGYVLGALHTDVQELSSNLYYFDSQSSLFIDNGGLFRISGNDLLTALGMDIQDLTTVLINFDALVYNSANKDLPNKNASNNFDFIGDEFNKVNILVFPTSQNKGFNETIYIYISNNQPNNYPSYEIKSLNYVYNSEKNPEGILVDFIQSDNTVTYSLDGSEFVSTLHITEEGSHKVYYKVVNPLSPELIVSGSEIVYVTIGESVIAFDNQKFITSPVHILSNDNHELAFTYGNNDNLSDRDPGTININKDVVTSLDDVYLVYTNLIKNSRFYDSITKEEINATVTVSEKRENSANFSYTISALGYDTINGIVKFDYSEIGHIAYDNSGSYQVFDEFDITLPIDYTVSLNEVSTVIPSRTALSLEDDYINYQTYYSIDNGKTWSTESPKITEVGNYSVYTLYCFVDKGNDLTDLVDGDIKDKAPTKLAANGNFIITIQNITVVE